MAHGLSRSSSPGDNTWRTTWPSAWSLVASSAQLWLTPCKDVETRIKRLGERARKLCPTESATMRRDPLRDEWKKAHDTGSCLGRWPAQKIGIQPQKDQVRRGPQRKQGIPVPGQRCSWRGKLKAKGHTQIQQGKDRAEEYGVGQAAALTASLAIPTKICGDYQAQNHQGCSAVGPRRGGGGGWRKPLARSRLTRG